MRGRAASSEHPLLDHRRREQLDGRPVDARRDLLGRPALLRTPFLTSGDLEAGRKRLAGDTGREATSSEVKALRDEATQLKEALAEAMLENRLLKKSVLGDGEDDT